MRSGSFYCRTLVTPALKPGPWVQIPATLSTDASTLMLSGDAPLGDVHRGLLPWLRGCYELLPVKYLWRIPISYPAAHVNLLPWTVVCCRSLPLLITFGFCTRSNVFHFFRKNEVVLRQLLIWKKSRSRGDGRRRSRNKAGLGLGGTNWESTTGISTPPCVK